jgi:hypothetical protein
MSSEAAQNPPGMSAAWCAAVRQPRFVYEGALTVLLVALSLYINVEIILYAQIRPAVPLNDPILGAVGPIRLTWPIFAVLWASIAIGVYCLAKNPPRLLMGLQAGALVISLRTIGIYLLPIEPLPTIIPLADPIAIYLGTGRLVTKDLFFSGHAAVMFLIFLSVEFPRMKLLLLAGTIFVSLGVMLQHVHYSVDVYAAPFFAYGSWRLVLLAHNRFK